MEVSFSGRPDFRAAKTNLSRGNLLLDPFYSLSCCAIRSNGFEHAQTLDVEPKLLSRTWCSSGAGQMCKRNGSSTHSGLSLTKGDEIPSRLDLMNDIVASRGSQKELDDDSAVLSVDDAVVCSPPKLSSKLELSFSSQHSANEALLKKMLRSQSCLNEREISTIWTGSDGKLVGLGVQAFGEEFDRHFDISSQKLAMTLGVERDCPTIPEMSEEQDEDEIPRTSIASEMAHQRTSRRSSRKSRISKKSRCSGESVKLRKAYASVSKVSKTSHVIDHSADDLRKWRTIFDTQKKDPPSWCLPVRLVLKIWEFVANDLLQYAASHCMNEDFDHVCLGHRCQWHHAEEPAAYRSDCILRTLRADMHLVVQRYVKPWTENFKDSGLALCFKAGRVSLHREDLEEASCPYVFISHCWNEEFKMFVKTLKHAFDPETRVWICSFAIWQHGDIQGQLTCLETCPFAVALAASQRVLVATEKSIEAISRCWCVLEATLSLKWNKPYDVSLPDKMNIHTWSEVASKVDMLDLKQCFSTRPSDKVAILAYAENSDGGIDGLNEVVRQVFRKASNRVKLLQAASHGDLEILQNATMDDLMELRDARGRGIIHIAALDGQVSSIMYVIQHLGNSMLDICDNAGMSPLCVAAHAGATAGIQGLLALQANLEQAAEEGLTPLHYAALGGSIKVVLMLLKKKADIEAQGKFRSAFGLRPLHLAAREGHTAVTALLMEFRADKNVHATKGSTVLWQAVHAGHTDVVVALLTAEADVNLRNADKFGRVPLMQAVKHDSLALVSLLVGAMADVDIEDGNGLTCLDYCTRNDTQVSRFIRGLIEKERRRYGRERACCRACVTS